MKIITYLMKEVNKENGSRRAGGDNQTNCGSAKQIFPDGSGKENLT